MKAGTPEHTRTYVRALKGMSTSIHSPFLVSKESHQDLLFHPGES